MANLRTTMIIFHSLTIGIILYFSSFLLSARFDSSSDQTIFITLGLLIFINSILRIKVLIGDKNNLEINWISKLSNFFRGIQLLITGLLIVDSFMRNIGSLEKNLIYILVLNGIFAIFYWNKQNQAKQKNDLNNQT